MVANLIAQAADVVQPESVPGGTVAWILTVVVGAVVTALLGHMRGKKAGAEEAQEMRVKPQPLTVKELKDPSWAEVAGIERRVSSLEVHFDDLRKEQTAMERRLTESAEKRATRLLASQADSAGKIHRRVDDILAAVSRLEGTLTNKS
jgi:hypothetical protein